MALKPEWLPTWLWAQTYDNNIYGVVVAAPGVYPTPIYESAMALGCFALLWALRRHPFRAGWLFSLYMVLAGAERLLIEQIRVNVQFTLHGVQFTQAEFIAVAFLAAGLTGMALLGPRIKATPLRACAAPLQLRRRHVAITQRPPAPHRDAHRPPAPREHEAERQHRQEEHGMLAGLGPKLGQPHRPDQQRQHRPVHDQLPGQHRRQVRFAAPERPREAHLGLRPPAARSAALIAARRPRRLQRRHSMSMHIATTSSPPTASNCSTPSMAQARAPWHDRAMMTALRPLR